MPTIPYKFYTGSANGRPYVQVLPGTNTPYGESETDLLGALNVLKSGYQKDIEQWTDLLDRQAIAGNQVSKYREGIKQNQNYISRLDQLINKYKSGQLTSSDLLGFQPINKGGKAWGVLDETSLQSIIGGNQVNSGLVSEYTNPLTGEKLTNVPQSEIDKIEAQVAGIKSGELVDLGGGKTVPKGSVVPTGTNAGTGAGINANIVTENKYENNEQAQAQGFYKIKVPITAQNPGGYDLYRADGTKVTDVNVFKPVSQGGLGLNADWIPDKTGIVQPGANMGATGASTGDSTGYTQAFEAYKSSLGGLWNQLDTSTQAFVESAFKLAQGQYDAGTINVSVNADLLNKAMTAAQTDPDILAKYGDALKLNQSSLQQQLSYINAEYAQQMGLTGMKQEQERKQLSEQYANLGQAISGFRNKAKEQLTTQQSGVIESSKRTLQNQLNTLGSQIESRYGTQGLTKFDNISAGGLAYNPMGGIVGTEEASKKSDIQNKAINEFNLIRLPT